MTDFNDKKLQEIYERAEKELFSVDRPLDRKFREDIDTLYSSSPHYRRMSLITFDLPSIYRTLSERFNIPMNDYGLLRKDTLHKILGEKEGKQDIAHSLSKGDVKDLLLYLADPLMVVHTVNDKGITVSSILDVKNQLGQNYLSFMHTFPSNRKGKVVTRVASVYAKRDLIYWINKREYNLEKKIIYANDLNKEISRILPYGPLPCVGGGSRPGHPVAEVIHPSLIPENILTRSELVNQRLMDHLTFLTLGIETALNSDKAKAFQKEHSKTPTSELLKEIHVKEKLKGRLPKMPKQQSNTLAKTKAKNKDGIIQQ